MEARVLLGTSSLGRIDLDVLRFVSTAAALPFSGALFEAKTTDFPRDM